MCVFYDIIMLFTAKQHVLNKYFYDVMKTVSNTNNVGVELTCSEINVQREFKINEEIVSCCRSVEMHR